MSTAVLERAEARTDVDVLTRAREILTEETWGRGELFCAGGKVCALGAVYTALGASIEEDRSAIIYPGDIHFPATELYTGNPSEYAKQMAEYTKASRKFETLFLPLREALDNASYELSDHSTVSVNDVYATTVADVHAIFDQAIQNLTENEVASV